MAKRSRSSRERREPQLKAAANPQHGTRSMARAADRRWRGTVIGGTLVAILLIGGFGALVNGHAPSATDAFTPAASSTSDAQPPRVVARSPDPSRAASGPGSADPASGPIDGIPCDANPHDHDFHIHAHLNIRVDGVLTLPPANVGVRAGCTYWLHTHAPYGVIHVESPDEQAFVLGQFFAIWGKPLSSSRVGDSSVGPGTSLFVFVDRVAIQVADPATIPVRDLSAIEIQIGAAPLTPLPYTFPSDLGGG
jgi:hypothetical protein